MKKNRLSMKIALMYQPSPTSSNTKNKKSFLISKQNIRKRYYNLSLQIKSKRQTKIGKKEPTILRFDFKNSISNDSFSFPSFMPLPTLLPKSVGNIGNQVDTSSKWQNSSANSLPKFPAKPRTNARALMKDKKKKSTKMLISSKQHSPSFKSILWTLTPLKSLQIFLI